MIDQMYQVWVDDLGVNGLVQNINIIADCGHYDLKYYPWHTRMIDMQCEKLIKLVPSLSMTNRIDLVIGLARMPEAKCVEEIVDDDGKNIKKISSEPISEIMKVVNLCMEGISAEQFSLRYCKLCFDNDFCETDDNYLLEDDDSTAKMIFHYLKKSGKEISPESVRHELDQIAKHILAEKSEPFGLVLDESLRDGFLKVGIPCITLTRDMKIPSVCNILFYEIQCI